MSVVLYGNPTHDSIIWIEVEGDKIVIYVWADINQDEPTHIIDLSGALESRRKPDQET